jgi:HTH-type transcriptional regulator/antitoxin HigA
MATIKPILNDEDHARAVERIEALLGAAPGTEEGEELAILAVLAEDYERRHHSIPAPTPIEAIRFRMDQMGLRPKDLEPFIGHSGRVSEVLAGSRSLTLEMIRKLSAGLKIPAELLIAYDGPRGSSPRVAKARAVKDQAKVASQSGT